MAGFKSYFPVGELNRGDRVRLSADESRHLTKSLRAKPGDPVTLFNGVGGAWSGILESLGGEAEVRIEAPMSIPEPQVEVSLAVGILKGKAMDAIVKGAVEMGAREMIPLFTSRTEVRLDEERAAAKREHWQTVAIEAMKQSGNLAPLSVREPMTLTSWLRAEPKHSVRIVASLCPDARPILDCWSDEGRDVCVLVGPEGDFSPEEYAVIGAAGFTAAALGSHILRAETACVYALAAIDAAAQRVG